MLGEGSIADFAVASFARGGSTDVLTVDAGSLILTGQDVPLVTTLRLDAGQLRLFGQDFPVAGADRSAKSRSIRRNLSSALSV